MTPTMWNEIRDSLKILVSQLYIITSSPSTNNFFSLSLINITYFFIFYLFLLKITYP